MDALKKEVSFVIGTAGHIDHGKTSLVKALTGMDTDRLKEEKRRGVSIDLGFAWMDLGEGAGRAALVDVPGHERFIRNMLAGTTGIDFVLFAVAADDGVMPQTREHLDIVRLLGVRQGVFAVTKSDLVGPERLSEVREEIAGLVKDTALEGAPILPVSSLTGKGMNELKASLKESCLKSGRVQEDGFFRLPIDRSFTVKGFGAVVTGTVASGSVKKGDELLCYPGGQRVKARGIQSLFMAKEAVSAGQRAALNLSGISHLDLKRGDLIVSTELEPFIEAARKKTHFVDCAFEFLPAAPGEKPRKIRNRAALKVHHLTGEALGVVYLLGEAEGRRAFGRLCLETPLLMMRGDRFILRDPAMNATIGGGEVLIHHISRELMPRAGKAFCGYGEKPGDIVFKLLSASGLGCSRFSLGLMLNSPQSTLADELARDARFAGFGEFIVARERLSLAKEKAVELLGEFHRANPMEEGAKDDILFQGLRKFASGVQAGKADDLLRIIIEEFAKDGAIRKSAGVWALPGHRAASGKAESKVESALLEIFSAFFQPDLDALGRLPFKKAEVDKVLAYLQRSGSIIKLKEGSFISAEAMKSARERLIGHLKAKGGIKASEFRDLIGTGRKFAIEILEYFDKERLTIRGRDDLRKLR